MSLQGREGGRRVDHGGKNSEKQLGSPEAPVDLQLVGGLKVFRHWFKRQKSCPMVCRHTQSRRSQSNLSWGLPVSRNLEFALISKYKTKPLSIKSRNCRLACITPLVLESPVTAIAFLPTSQDHSENMSRLLAVGLENGKLVVVRYDQLITNYFYFTFSNVGR